jgi:riboflavin biosynthesis pyrimidine reductase
VSTVFRTLLAPSASADAQEPPEAPVGARITLERVLDEVSFGKWPDRPWVVLNMISTADGRATIAGRSGPLGNRADRELFHGLRTLVDAVMVGAQTVRTEHYDRPVSDAGERMRRLTRGLAEEPVACVVSSSLVLDPMIPLIADPLARVVVLTPAPEATVLEAAAQISYVRAARDGRLDLPRSMRTLRERFGVRALLCEGGPHLAGQLLAAGLLDELFLTLAPKLTAGEVESDPGGSGPALSIVSGPALDPPVALRLRSALESGSYLFLRYEVVR